MAEKITINNEVEHNYEKNRDTQEYRERIAVHHEAKAEKSHHEHLDNIDEILERIETSAKTGAELNKSPDVAPPKKNYANPNFVGKQLKDNQLKRSISGIQRELKAYQRPFSKLIHNGVVEFISDSAEKTIARPKGLLAGGLLSLIISLGFLICCKYYGYEYNYLVGLISFPVGFVLGTLGELVFKPLKR